ncbi:MAG: phosphoribosylglycinamide formyltransferase [Candidatus Thermoplasmatota archaeon]|nr:phosphoribosylglycinamide formyltransferase [Candidatus Thermoplasmatota archaeon]
MTLKVAVLASGRGSNFQALLDEKNSGELEVEFCVLVVNNKDAGAIGRAEANGIPWRFVDHRGKTREDFEKELIGVLDVFEPELVVLAGFMRILTPLFVEHYEGRLINIHPALLPSFPGTHGQLDALEHGVKVSGCTVHFVNTAVDGGPIILQRTVPVMEDDTVETLSARIIQQEHKALPEAVRLFAEKRLRLEGRRVRILPP